MLATKKKFDCRHFPSFFREQESYEVAYLLYFDFFLNYVVYLRVLTGYYYADCSLPWYICYVLGLSLPDDGIRLQLLNVFAIFLTKTKDIIGIIFQYLKLSTNRLK